MSEIRMKAEVRTDYDCETTGLPAERWGEAVFNVGDEELVFEVSVEKDIIIAMMLDENTAWKGTLAGLKKIIKESLNR